MKRYNIHLDEGQVTELDKILAKVKGNEQDHWSIDDLSRADLIRFAIADTFQFKYDRIHGYDIDLAELIKKAIKKKELKKGV